MATRAQAVPTGAYTLGRFRLEPGRQLLASGEPVPIGGKALQLLSVLARAQGDLVTKDELMDAVWPGIVVEENAIQVHISAARKALEEEASRLVTVRGKGYRLRAGGRDRDPVDERPSLAVLAFDNLTGDPDKDYLSDGIAEELITTLSRSSDLRVAARTSSFAYRGRRMDVRTIAQELGVRLVLEGSVRFAGDRIRVTAQLIEAESGCHVWAQNFDRTVHELLDLEEDLAQAIARLLKAKVGVLSRPRDPLAYQLHLQARGLAGRLSLLAIEKAIELHKQAISMDPSFARSWAALAGTLMVGTVSGLLPLQRRAESRAAVEQALSLDPGAAAPHAIRAGLDASAGRWLEAADGFEAAVELDPDEPTVLGAMALALWAPAGHLAKAAALLQRAVEIAPAAPNLRLELAFVSLIAGELEPARVQLDMAELLGVNIERSLFRIVAAELALAGGRVDEAAAAYAAALHMYAEFADLGSEDVLCKVLPALTGTGESEAAAAAITALAAQVEARSRPWSSPGAVGHLIRWLTLLGAVDAALDLCESLVAAWQRTDHLTTLSLCQLWRPEMVPLRANPRFYHLVTALELRRLWDAYGGPDPPDCDRGSGSLDQSPGSHQITFG